PDLAGEGAVAFLCPRDRTAELADFLLSQGAKRVVVQSAEQVFEPENPPYAFGNSKAMKREPCAVLMSISTAFLPSCLAVSIFAFTSLAELTALPATSRITSPEATPFDAAWPVGSTLTTLTPLPLSLGASSTPSVSALLALMAPSSAIAVLSPGNAPSVTSAVFSSPLRI